VPWYQPAKKSSEDELILQLSNYCGPHQDAASGNMLCFVLLIASVALLFSGFH